jgi:hypothetical protein
VTERAKHPVVVVGPEVHRRRLMYERAWFDEDDFLGEPAAPPQEREKKPQPLPPFLEHRR